MITDADLDRLDELAVAAAAGAYVPHSVFHVGAAVLAADGTVTTGANIESDSYGLTCCAERVAVFHHVTHSRSPIVAVAVACPDGDPAGDPHSVTPCGACRQVLAEHVDGGPISIVGVGRFTADELLPIAFRITP